MTCLKNPGTFAFPGLWPLCNLRGRCHPVNALKFSLQLSSEAGALIQRQGSTFKSCLVCAALGAFCSHFPARQLTKRRIRTFITIPSAINMNNKDEPP